MATFQQIIDLARIPLNDAAGERYTDPELLAYALDGVREAIVLRPDAFCASGLITLQAGVEQTTPASSWFIVDILSNQNDDEVLEADYRTFRGFNPSWRRDPPAAPEIWMRMPTDKGPDNRFYVYPPARAGDQVSALYVNYNASALALTDTVPFDDVYLPALEYYITARAEAKDDQHTVTQRTTALHQAFAGLLGVGAQTEEVKP